MVLAAVAAGLWAFRSTPRPVVSHLALPNFEGLIIGRNQIAVSPDGRRIAYYSNGRAYVRDLATFDSRIIGETIVGQAAFSPDGQTLAVWSGLDNTIRRVDISGGASNTLCHADNVLGMTWHASGIVSGQAAKGILRCPLDGRPAEQLATVTEAELADGPQILPGGEALLFSIAKATDGPTRWDNAQVVVQRLKTGERKTVIEGGSAARYLPTGHLVYARGGILFAVPFSLERLEVIGQAVTVLEGVRRTNGVTGGAQFAVSDTGDLFYIPGPVGSANPAQAIALADRAGVLTRLTIPPGAYEHVRVSSAGARLAIGTDDGKVAGVWTYRLREGGALQRLTLEGRNRFPVWSPKGDRVAFQSDRGGDLAIFAQRVDGTDRAVRLTTPAQGESHVPNAWSPDGRHILVTVIKGSELSLSTLSVNDGKLERFGQVASRRPIDAVFSPDGQWVAYSRSSSSYVMSPQDGVFVQPFPATGAVYQAPKIRIDFHPVWMRDSAELIYVPSAASDQLVAVKVTSQAGLTFGPPLTFPARVTGNRLNTQPRAYDILPDGHFIGPVDAWASDAPGETSTREIRVVLNWIEEFKERMARR
jgi:Tol biopolymer transport system component